jgi:predicted nucleotidyltransferase
MGALATLDPHGLRLLRVLLGGGPPMTGRALARVTGISQSTAHRALTRLRDAGLVVAERTPPAVVYRANAEHLAMPALVALIRLEELLRARFAEHVAGWRRRPESMVLYGSVARGQATPASDIDVLAVRPDGIEPDEETWQGQIAELSDRVLRWTGRRASVIDMSATEATEGLAAREPYLVEADRDGWLIAGRALHELSAQAT